MKKTLYITSGAPNAGKTTFVNQRIDALGGVHISRDEIRARMLKPGDFYFKNESKVFNEFINEIQKAIDRKWGPSDIYIDATHLNARSRSKVLNRLNKNNVDKIIVLWFDPPLGVLLERNKKEDGTEKVPEDAIKKMKDSMDIPSKNEFLAYKPEIWRIDEEGWIIDVYPQKQIMCL